MRHAAQEMSARPPGQRFLFWLGEAARQLREEHGLGPSAVSARLGVREATVESFEKAKNMPRDLEALLAAYAAVCDLDDPRDIVRDALRLWYECGEGPNDHAPESLNSHPA